MELSALLTVITKIIQDAAYTEEVLTDKINSAVSMIAAGIRMPNGQISPSLPDLYKYDVVNTDIDLPYVSLPADYQRNVFNIYDDTLYQILPPRGGDYYSFSKFLKQINKLDLSETGEIYRVCIKGTQLYYQGIPSTAFPLGVHYYRKPVAMTDDNDIPDGIPEHLQERLIKHYVVMNLYGETIEAGVTEPAVGTKYHTDQFYRSMQDLVDFIGIDAEPQYYGDNGSEDRGVCD